MKTIEGYKIDVSKDWYHFFIIDKKGNPHIFDPERLIKLRNDEVI